MKHEPAAMVSMIDVVQEALPRLGRDQAWEVVLGASELWNELAALGIVDTFGGMESRRVLKTVLETIDREANAPAPR